MELGSTVSFKDIDIDKMMEHTTLDDFLKGLYINQAGAATKGPSEHDKIMAALFGKEEKEVVPESKGPSL
jgi:hypothetical protein